MKYYLKTKEHAYLSPTYSQGQVLEILEKRGCTEIDKENEFGWFNQCKVFTFRPEHLGTAYRLEEDLGEDYQVRRIWLGEEEESTQEQIEHLCKEKYISKLLVHYFYTLYSYPEVNNETEIANDSKELVLSKVTTFLFRVSNIFSRYLNEGNLKVSVNEVYGNVGQLVHYFSLHQQGHESFRFPGHPLYNQILAKEADFYGRIHVEVGDDNLIHITQ